MYCNHTTAETKVGLLKKTFVYYVSIEKCSVMVAGINGNDLELLEKANILE